MPEHYDLDTRMLDQIMANTPERLEKWLDALSEDILGDIKLSFGDSPPGRTYVRGGVTHVASAPGYPPNVDTGALRASMQWAREGRMRRIIYDGVEYGIMMEEGTDDIAPRPFIQPVFHDWRGRIGQHAAEFGLFR